MRVGPCQALILQMSNLSLRNNLSYLKPGFESQVSHLIAKLGEVTFLPQFLHHQVTVIPPVSELIHGKTLFCTGSIHSTICKQKESSRERQTVREAERIRLTFEYSSFLLVRCCIPSNNTKYFSWLFLLPIGINLVSFSGAFGFFLEDCDTAPIHDLGCVETFLSGSWLLSRGQFLLSFRW